MLFITCVGDASEIVVSSEEVDKIIEDLKKQFRHLKNSVREWLDKRKVLVEQVADVLTSLSPDEDDHHKMFTKEHISNLLRAYNYIRAVWNNEFPLELSRP